jgi:hypothetical protein
MSRPTVTFETKCYENDWEYLLKTDRLRKMIGSCHYDFDVIMLSINNVADHRTVRRYAEKLLSQGLITTITNVEEHADEALRFFESDRSSFDGGYYYSIAELVAIYLCKTDYLLHFSSDSIMWNDEEWIGAAVDMMENDRRIAVANPTWNNKYHRAKEASYAENDDFYIANGFSDQCYLIRTSVFRAPIYNETNDICDSAFPAYGGNSFEKKADAYLRNHGYLRITHKKASYRHKNFSRSTLKKWIMTHFPG